jgi:hypothetical protein
MLNDIGIPSSNSTTHTHPGAVSAGQEAQFATPSESVENWLVGRKEKMN